MSRPAKVYRPTVEISAWCGRLVPVLPAFALNILNRQRLTNDCFQFRLLRGFVGSFSGAPFTSEGGTKSCKGFGSAASLQCTEPPGVSSAGQAVRGEAALDSFQSRMNSSGERSASALWWGHTWL